MSYYFNIETNEYPRHIGDLQLLGWSVGLPLPSGWVEVEDTVPPSISSTQVCYETLPVNISGTWKRNWEVREATEEELQKRNTALPIDKGFGPFSWDAYAKEWKPVL